MARSGEEWLRSPLLKKLAVALLAKKADLEEENGGERDGSLGMEEVKDRVADESTMAGVVEGKILIGNWNDYRFDDEDCDFGFNLFGFLDFRCNFHVWGWYI